jgi:hypothetical protein
MHPLALSPLLSSIFPLFPFPSGGLWLTLAPTGEEKEKKMEMERCRGDRLTNNPTPRDDQLIRA